MPDDIYLRPDARLIGIGGLAGSGKSTAGRMMQDMLPGLGLVPFALAVKDIARDQFGWDGLKDERGRRLLQVIGTEAGRAYDEDIWIKKVAAFINHTNGKYWLIDDVRFPNECDFIKAHGLSIRLIRAGTGLTGDAGLHQSETQIDHCKWHVTLMNNWTLGELKHDLYELLIEERFIQKHGN